MEENDERNNRMNDWIITNGILKEYNGDGERVIIPDTVTSVESYAFKKAKNLRELVIPESVNRLGGRAIYLCRTLERVEIKSAKLVMDYHIFQGCESLKEVVFNSCNTYIPVFCFSDCKSLEELVIPSTVSGIGDHAFDGCSSLKRLVLEGTQIALGASLFGDADSSFHIEYAGDSESFMKLIRRKVRIENQTYGDYQHGDVIEVTVKRFDYPFGRVGKGVETKVHCRADGKTLIFFSDKYEQYVINE